MRTAPKYFDGDAIDRIQQFVLLASCLPRGGGQPREARCKECRAYLGGLVTDRAIVFGDFERHGDELSQLIGASRFDRSVTITCTKCRRKNQFCFRDKD
jgi:hypothetical protein